MVKAACYLILGFMLGLVVMNFAKRQSPPDVAAPADEKISALPPKAKVSDKENYLERQLVDWDAVAHGNLSQAIALLLRANVPRRIIEDFARGRTERETLAVWVDHIRAAKPRRFWKDGVTDGDRLAQWVEGFYMNPIKAEMLKRLQSAGINARGDASSDLRSALLAYKYPGLASEKREALDMTRNAYAEAMVNLKMGYPPQSEELAKLASLRKAFDSDLTKLLGPTEKRQYDLAYSDSAKILRQELRYFTPTQEEFEKLWTIRTEVHQPSQTAFNSLTVLRDNENAAIFEAFGTERFMEYERSMDSYYREVRNFAESTGIDPDWANDVYEMHKAFDQKFVQFMSDATLSGDQKRDAVIEYKREVENVLKQKLGDDRFAAFKRHPAGMWVDQIYQPFSK